MNGAPQTPIDRPALRERGEQLAQPLGAGHGVELVAALSEPRRGVEVVVGAERHDEDVGLVDAAVGGHPPASGSIAVIVSCRKRTPGFAISR